jgi:FlaA1/EpsC-like NDP-sugar epimerase
VTPRRKFRKVLLCGAGEAGRMIAREILHNSSYKYICVGFLDDDEEKFGWEIESAPILGPIDELPRYVAETGAEEVLITVPSASGALVRRVSELCDSADVPFRVLPSLFQVIHGDAMLTQVRDVRLEDLLRRAPIELDLDLVSRFIAGKTVLVTGAGGSIGEEICCQVATFDPAKLILLGHGENSIFDAYHNLYRCNPTCEKVTAIVDLRDKPRLAKVLEVHSPEIIFHAAAHKHVPLMEENPCEAFANNVGSMLALSELAPAHGVRQVILISTDKAVEPCNAMGASKAVCEVISHLADRDNQDTSFTAVRFGNVLGSRGSVLELFRRQMEGGGPVTVTDERMERFFMTIPEAVELVLQAAAVGTGGEIFVLDMGQPLRIKDLAKMLIELSGYTTDEIPIMYTGLRPGERLTERLFSAAEERLPSPHPQVMIARHNGVYPELWGIVRELHGAAVALKTGELAGLVKRIVPDSTWEPEGAAF